MTSVFAKQHRKVWQHRYNGELSVRRFAGGTPSDPKIAEAWLKTKFAEKDDLIRAMVAEIMTEREVSAEEAITLGVELSRLCGFKRNGRGLYYEGRSLKAAIKEAALVALGAGTLPKLTWGNTKKGLTGFLPEHVMVVDHEILLGVEAPTRIEQGFVHAFRAHAPKYFEVVDECTLSFTVETDVLFDEEFWQTLWLTGEMQGVGAERSQGYGRYDVTRWEKVKP